MKDRTAIKVGRNDRCPCGSDMKFKKCCGGPNPQAIQNWPTVRKNNLKPITPSMCRRIVRSLNKSEKHFGLRKNPTCTLATTIKQLEWLASVDKAPLIPAAWESNPERTRKAFLRIEQAQRLANALERIRNVPGAPEKVRSVLKEYNRLKSQDEPSQDILFEIEIAGRLAINSLSPAFDEPDIIVGSSSLWNELGIACKRPRKVSTFPRNLADAARQINSSGTPGVIVANLEPLFHRSQVPRADNPKKMKPIVWKSDTIQELDQYADNIANHAMKYVKRDLRRLFEKHQLLLGVIFAGMITGWNHSPAANIWQWRSHTVVNPHVEGSQQIVERLSNLIRGDALAD